MRDKVRFFTWSEKGKIVAFSMCLIHQDAVFAEYVGFDYAVAFNLSLYHVAVRDMINWSIERGYKWFRSSGLNYDPKFHMRHQLDPIDLYVRHTSPLINFFLSRFLPVLEPVRGDKILKMFPNYHELYK